MKMYTYYVVYAYTGNGVPAGFGNTFWRGYQKIDSEKEVRDLQDCLKDVFAQMGEVTLISFQLLSEAEIIDVPDEDDTIVINVP